MKFHVAFAGGKYLLLGLGVVIYVYAGMPFLKGMVSEIRDKAIGMITLVALDNYGKHSFVGGYWLNHKQW